MKVISGGQTGVDVAALRAARACGLPTGGWAPKGWLIESPDGKGTVSAPWLADFGLVECREAGYPARTRANIRSAGATLILISDESQILRGGTALTLKACEEAHRGGSHGLIVAMLGHPDAAENVFGFLRGAAGGGEFVSVLNVAGPRESKAPGVGAFAQSFLHAVFAKLAGLCEV